MAALIGALAILLAAGADLGRLEWFAQLYSVFFAVYLTALQLGGVLPSVIAGNASIIVMVVAHRAVRPATLTRASLAVVLMGGVAMTAARDDHGAGILIGVTIACLVLARRRILAHPLAPGALTVLFGAVPARQGRRAHRRLGNVVPAQPPRPPATHLPVHPALARRAPDLRPAHPDLGRAGRTVLGTSCGNSSRDFAGCGR